MQVARHPRFIPMGYTKLDQAGVHTALVTYLETQLAIDGSRVLELVDPMSPPDLLPTGPYFVSVVIGEGTFPFSEQGAPQLNEEFQLTSTAYTKLWLDAPGSEHELLHEATRGLLYLKKQLLKALAGANVVVNANSFLRDRITIASASRPDFDPLKGVGWVAVTCDVSFDWDFT